MNNVFRLLLIWLIALFCSTDSWAANGMLKSVTRPDKREVAFEYDALGRRTAKTFDGQVTRFVWDGNNPLHEWSYPLNERPQKVTDDFGFVTKVGTEPTENITTWIFEEGTFRPTAKITNDEKFSIVTDYLGTPAEMYDKFGIKVWSAILDIYGKVRTFEGNKYAPEQTSCPFRYQGQYEDAETGLYYNRFRYYDPNMGNYLSQDPIGLAGVNPTLYGYVIDTGLWLDVFGLDPVKLFEITTYQDFTNRSVVNDKLAGHELLQHSWLKNNGYVTERLANSNSKNNIVIALDDDLHRSVNKAQRNLDIKNQTAFQNIDANADILKKLNVDAKIVDDAAVKAKAHAKSIGCK